MCRSSIFDGEGFLFSPFHTITFHHFIFNEMVKEFSHALGSKPFSTIANNKKIVKLNVLS